MKIEYQVRPVTRYIVTRYHSDDTDRSGGVETKGEFDNQQVAYEVGYALCKDEHQRLGYPLGDERIQYPKMHMAEGLEPAKKAGLFIGDVGPIGTGGTA